MPRPRSSVSAPHQPTGRTSCGGPCGRLAQKQSPRSDWSPLGETMNPENLPLEARIQRLEDTESIRTLKSRYHTLVNDTDFDNIGSLFAADASLRLGYLMPDQNAIVGHEKIQAAFSGMKTNTSQSQLKQFFHSHIVELTGSDSASGTGMLYACYGVHSDAYVLAGKYIEDYVRVEGAWLFKKMDSA